MNQGSKILLLDGATGTELGRRGVDIRLPLWSARALLDAPEVLAGIHRDYLEAGAGAITANTFRTHHRSLPHSSVHIANLLFQIVAIGRIEHGFQIGKLLSR